MEYIVGINVFNNKKKYGILEGDIIEPEPKPKSKIKIYIKYIVRILIFILISWTIPTTIAVSSILNVSYQLIYSIGKYTHEFGHVMHEISSEASISGLGGTNCETDFVECPSQLFEEWCYYEQPLKIMAPNITSDAIAFINKERKMMKGVFNKRQLCIAKFDMGLHGDNVVVNNAMLFNNVYNKSFKINMPSEINFGATFAHIMSGYEAGYYSYLWSQVYAKDIYENKFKGYELDPVVGQEFRRKILAKGGTVDSIDALTEYLGRLPNSEAFGKSFLT